MKPFKLFKKIMTKKNAALFGAAVLLCTCLAAARPYLMEMLNPAATAAAAAKKQLPIYCVDTGTSKKVAVSFDAAWGAGRWRRKAAPVAVTLCCTVPCSIG